MTSVYIAAMSARCAQHQLGSWQQSESYWSNNRGASSIDNPYHSAAAAGAAAAEVDCISLVLCMGQQAVEYPAHYSAALLPQASLVCWRKQQGESNLWFMGSPLLGCTRAAVQQVSTTAAVGVSWVPGQQQRCCCLCQVLWAVDFSSHISVQGGTK